MLAKTIKVYLKDGTINLYVGTNEDFEYFAGKQYLCIAHSEENTILIKKDKITSVFRKDLNGMWKKVLFKVWKTKKP